MRPLAASTLALIEEILELAERPQWPWNRAGILSRLDDRLSRLTASGEWRTVSLIISLSLHERPEIRSRIHTTLQALIACASLRQLPLLDRSLRQRSRFRGPGLWFALRSSDERLVHPIGKSRTMLQLAMSHPDGRVRSLAIEAASRDAGGHVALLLLRSNDWVKPVRQQAHQVLREVMRAGRHSEFVAALPLIQQMTRWGRVNDDALLGELDALLATADAAPHLVAAFQSPDRFLRRAACECALGSPFVEDPVIFHAALRDRDPVSRLWASRQLCRAPDELFMLFQDTMLRDRHGSIRYAAARHLIRMGQSFDWERFLCDGHAGVRALAQDSALDSDRAAEAEYRRLVDSSTGRQLAHALLGLGETGGAADHTQVRRGLENEHARVRRAALLALASLRVGDLVAVCLEALSDVARSVVRTARDLLVRHAPHVQPYDVWAVFSSLTTNHGRTAALQVVAGLEFWSRLPYLLKATTAPDDEVHERALRHLWSWLGRSFRVYTSLPLGVLRDIHVALPKARLPARLRREFEELVERQSRA